MKNYRKAISALVVGLLAVGVSACGSSSSSSGGSTSGAPKIPLKAGENPAGQNLYNGTKGGTLTVQSSEDFAHLDPGEAYFSLDYAIMYATQRPLFTYPPNSTTTLAPDLATAVPTLANGGISKDGKTVTVHIEPNVKFGPPVNRTVTSADVAYAIDRGANPNVGNGYFGPYFGDLVGASKAKGGAFAGVTTPNSTTLVFHLMKPTSAVLIGALSLPLSAPVPMSFVAPLDKHQPTTYGSTYEVATGPYEIEAKANGDFAGLGYQTGKSLTLVRNPNWNAGTYASSAYKPPAYLNRVNIEIGGDASVIGPEVLKGSDTVQLDTPSNSTVQLAYTKYPSQINFTPGAGDHYLTLNNAHGVFTNMDIRRAVYANLDRASIIKIIGGPLVGEPATHFITPGTDGFTEAGGYAGPNYPWATNVNGNLAVAKKYMKLAGYPSGKYTGNKTVLIVGSNNGNDPAINQVVSQAMTELGLKTRLIQVDQSVMYSKYCEVPKEEVDACPSGGWLRDFDNPLTVLYVPWNGAAIVPTNNSNFGQVNNPQINAAMNAASTIQNPTAAAAAWGKIDELMVNDAVGVPEDFDNQPNIRAGNVREINDLWNEGSVDVAFTSLTKP